MIITAKILESEKCRREDFSLQHILKKEHHYDYHGKNSREWKILLRGFK